MESPSVSPTGAQAQRRFTQVIHTVMHSKTDKAQRRYCPYSFWTSDRLGHANGTAKSHSVALVSPGGRLAR